MTLNRDRERDGDRAMSGERDREGERDKDRGYDALAATASIGRSILSTVSHATSRGTRAISLLGGDDRSPSTRPALLARASSGRVFPTTAVATPVVTVDHSPSVLVNANGYGYGSSGATTPYDRPLPSVEMASIVSDDNQPPTVLLSRQNLGFFFQSSKSIAGRASTGERGRMQTATRFMGSDPPLTDRYGFICEFNVVES